MCVIPEGSCAEDFFKDLIEAFSKVLNTVVLTLHNISDPESDPGQQIAVDLRLTLKEFKATVVAPLVHLEPNNIKIFKPSYYYYSDKSPTELTVLTNTMATLLPAYPDKIFWQQGRALEENQTLIDLYLFDNRQGHPFLFEKMFEAAFTTTCTLGELRHAVLLEIELVKTSQSDWKYKDLPFSLDNIRIRDVKRFSEGPGYLYLDDSMSLDLFKLSVVRQLCVQVCLSCFSLALSFLFFSLSFYFLSLSLFSIIVYRKGRI